VAPNRTETEFRSGLDALIAKSWYLHKRDNGAWHFSRNENLTKKIERRTRKRLRSEDAGVSTERPLGRRVEIEGVRSVRSPRRSSAHPVVDGVGEETMTNRNPLSRFTARADHGASFTATKEGACHRHADHPTAEAWLKGNASSEATWLGDALSSRSATSPN
jgi:hypothetical protein